MVHRVARRAINDRAISNIFPIMNHNRPDINKREQRNIREFLQREDKREDMIRQALRPAIQRMESMRRVRRGHDPPMMRLVQGFVDLRVVQPPVDEVDEEVGEEDKERELQVVVRREGG